MRRWIILTVALAVFTLLALPFAALYYAAFTQDGLQRIASLIPRRLGSVQVDIVGVSGTVASGVHVDRVEIEHERVHLRFDGIDAKVTLAPLLLQTLRLPEATIQSASILVRSPTHVIPPSGWHFLPHWLEIRPDHLRILRGTLTLPSGERFEATDLAASGIVRSRTVRVFAAQMDMENVRTTARGLLQAAEPLRLDAESRITIRSRSQPTWIFEAAGKGDLNLLPFTVRFEAPLRAEVVGRALALTENWRWAGTARVDDLNLAAWGASPAIGQITGELAVKGDARGFSARGPLTPAGLHVGAFEGQWVGSYSHHVFTANHIELTHTQSGASLNGSGSIAIIDNGPRLDLTGTWKEFRWPLTGRSAALRSPQGEYVLRGVLPYELHGSGRLVPRGRDPMDFRLLGTLDKQQLRVDQGSVAALGGQFELAGAVAWTPTPAWSASGTAKDVNPVSIRPDLPGQLTFGFDIEGSRFDASSDFALQVRSLAGQVRNFPVHGAGEIERHGTVWQLRNVKTDIGHTSLALDGTLSSELALRFNLQAQDLSLLDPDFRGRLLANGAVYGTLRSPAINASASGTGLQFAGVSLAGFDARIDFDPQRRGKSLVSVHARDFTHGARKLDELDFTLDGTPAQSVARLNLAATDLKLQARAEGALDDGVWRGQLRTLSISGTEPLELKLESAEALLFSADAIRVEKFCLAGSPAHLCGRADWNRQQWSAAVEATELPIKTLTAGIKSDIDYRGIISVTAHAQRHGDEPIRGDVSAQLTDAKLVHRLAAGRLETTTLGTGHVLLEALPESIRASLDLEAGDLGFIKGEANAQRKHDAWADMPLKGELHLQSTALQLATLYVPQIDRAAGRAAAELTLGGSLGTPLLTGMLKVTDGELDVYQLNLAMRATTLQAHLVDNGLDFNGTTRIGAGTASTRGHLEWRHGMPFGKLNLSGENLRMVDVPEAQIDASPNLDFGVEGQNITVDGAVRIPEAKIVPKDLTNAVRSSSDEVVVGEEIADPAQRFHVVSHITLTLGDHVSIDTSGLKGRLTGNIAVRSGEEAVTRATGELSIADGEYAAYGRRLDIEHGRLIFNSSPVENPGIDIRAVKRFDDPTIGATVAGVNVRGTLLQPRLTFFSEPPLPQQQIVSLILAGGALAGGSQFGTSPATASTRGTNAELVGQGAAILGQQLGARVGIADVGVESTFNNDTSLVFGRYLAPRIYVSYGINLTQSLNSVKLRYTLGDHWVVRTELGQVGGADLVYSIDK
jgi:translocation and assembly module TamB